MGIIESFQDVMGSFVGSLNMSYGDNDEDAERQAWPESYRQDHHHHHQHQHQHQADHGSRNYRPITHQSMHASTSSYPPLLPPPSAPSREPLQGMGSMIVGNSSRTSHNTTRQQQYRHGSLGQHFSREDYADLYGKYQHVKTEIRALQEKNSVLRYHLEQETQCRQEMEQKYADVHSKLEKQEALHAQQALPDSSSYQDSAATPPLLQNAADGVKEAIVVCATEFFSKLRKISRVNVNAVQVDVPKQQRSNEVMKAGLQGVLCRVLFQGFEDPYFTLAKNHNSPFQTPSERKAALFQAYKMCRDCSEAKRLLLDDNDFRSFFEAKVALMNEEVITWLSSSANAQSAVGPSLDEILNPNNEESIYKQKFLRAAKTVWVLHKLAMAFEPSAEIFRVDRGSFLNGTYMEDVATYDEDAEGNENTLLEKIVWFMCVPGFIVRHTVIKSRVFCLLNMKAESSDAKEYSQTEAGNGVPTVDDIGADGSHNG